MKTDKRDLSISDILHIISFIIFIILIVAAWVIVPNTSSQEYRDAAEQCRGNAPIACGYTP
jgi:hypothetical protein